MVRVLTRIGEVEGAWLSLMTVDPGSDKHIDKEPTRFFPYFFVSKSHTWVQTWMGKGPLSIDSQHTSINVLE